MFGEPPTRHPHCQDVCWNRKEAYESREGEGGLSERGMEAWKGRPQRRDGIPAADGSGHCQLFISVGDLGKSVSQYQIRRKGTCKAA